MHLLLDTHVVLWALTDNARLSIAARDAIADGDNLVFVSAVSAWEITIKRSLGKLRAPDDLVDQLRAAHFDPLHLTVEHALAVGELPDLHRDPFDRMLVAQARVETLTIVTADPQVLRYEVVCGLTNPGRHAWGTRSGWRS